MTKAEAKRRVMRCAAHILSRNNPNGLWDQDGLFQDGYDQRVSEEDAHRLFDAMEGLVKELWRRGQEPEDKK